MWNGHYKKHLIFEKFLVNVKGHDIKRMIYTVPSPL